MASIFRRDDNFTEQPNRVNYDMSFQNNITTDFGSLRPCAVFPVLPGESYRFKPTFGLRFLPMVFPVQTRMKASIHYFYVRNRNLWKDWPDFIGKTKSGLTPPYIHLTAQNRKQVETCQLGDFLGLPTVVYQDVKVEDAKYFNKSWQEVSGSSGQYAYIKWSQLESFGVNSTFFDLTFDSSSNIGDLYAPVYDLIFNDTVVFRNTKRKELFIRQSVTLDNPVDVRFYLTKGDVVLWKSDVVTYPAGGTDLQDNVFDVSDVEFGNDSDVIRLLAIPQMYTVLESQHDLNTGTWAANFISYLSDRIDVAELDLSRVPWRSDANPDGIPLSALPFRAYESIYNSFYRNAENNPFLINGTPEYNKWIRTNEGGADTNFYPIMYHNWEDDFLTTAVPSPQQGNAPLVGLTGTATMTIGHDDGTTTEMSLEVDENGGVVSATPVSGDGVTQQAIVEAVSYGISINDFRNVNSFQRWLENNIRRGYKYRDQIKTHYGVTVRYDELDMPEFIGGTSQPVMVNQISQTTPTETSPLGDMAGQASAVGQGSDITQYCDEHGWIIAILCVKPVANYSQLLPKYFNVTDTFDYYFPEFGHIGMQPITYKEVTPLQAHLEGKLNDVFGYQRAWYDLISKTDEVHGLFRSEFRDFLINRTFDGTPELGKDFTVMDPNQLNEVFAVTENRDKILGQIYMDVSKKSPIPLYGIAKLE